MTRTKNAARRKNNKGGSKPSTPSTSTSAPTAPVPQPTVQELLVQSARSIASLNYEAARHLCIQAAEIAQEEGSKEGGDWTLLRDSLEILGTVELELNELPQAREHFIASIQLASSLPDPSPAPHLYLAQLSETPQESLQHFSNALEIFKTKLVEIERLKLGGDGSAGGVDELEDEGEIRRSASRALVGMTELYLTDLCFEDNAEQKCEEFLKQASELDPSDPEVYQTLASVRLSQSRPEDAKEAANRGYLLWKNLENNSPLYPPPSARLSCAKLFLELSLHVPALEILHTLENEDDEDSETWYLSGWAWWLLGEERSTSGTQGTKEDEEEEETKEECWSEARLCFENYLRIESMEPEMTDQEQLQHVQETMAKLDAAGIVASKGAAEEEGDGTMDGQEWEDEEEDDEMMD